ncbi:bifunctional tRNA (5-methylaminomethyl-2-thiouridine)(34)-methyltransferase MnmD/FAD-dependent 5-carboxymethylaminomethyl-2-thiouridine(34) oxidoreductase MnmC [uncultured Pseudoteredinibacter sp.]|uniref:bifunctional tRNA (5-methylaminomethyl-2-thiouridine)(34)-methyltransferase MnmD/FAD-dependent 5-carboxymethylaminomethyl-2-thiouridine(34) oxidoreductase MnmC n=1 Tax=uncultured Pseudoteredinibacter sp. TaxID=1641701 RepID=UPI00260474CA|nr:bifunctional tRNA (5-methylaminomethyl-2-thiouridine)(34)-methyltransferase MnmD/FAD-dependent 5-carboxymethylaminomethyl-2-thiouridine(34) oxidoreductase MnmC [uncultured Pseudoteredinibacter sp.]
MTQTQKPESKANAQQSLADIRWEEDQHPICQRFDDYYFSSDNGLEETQHNFIRPSQLESRFKQLGENEVFRLAETGFGTGLNFLTTWQLWQQSNNNSKLEFYSFEKYPLNRQQLSKALEQWSSLSAEIKQLCEAYPSLTSPGWHRLEFPSVSLNLFIGDVAEGLKELYHSQHPRFAQYNRKINAWFLDGFAPAKNPDMWRAEVLQSIAELSMDGASLATFTAASAVRKGLIALGFDMQKSSGYGLKREMMSGSFHEPEIESLNWPESAHNCPHEAPWALALRKKSTFKKQVNIIGGGIAACCTARALAEAGFQVRIIERQQALAQEGSGNPQGVLYAKLSHRAENLSQFNLQCLHYAQSYYHHFKTQQGIEADLCGVAQLATTEKQCQQQEKLTSYLSQFGCTTDFVQQLDARQLSKAAGVELKHGALYFPLAGWLNPASACNALCQHPNITIHIQQEVQTIERVEGHWECYDKNQSLIHSSDILIIANANEAKRFEQTAGLPLKPVRGQVSYLPATESSNELKTVICGQGYIAPANNQQHCLGASFNLKEQSLELKEQEQYSNLKHLEEDCPSIFDALEIGSSTEQNTAALKGRVALRCTSPDYLPILGPAPKQQDMQSRFNLLSRNAKAAIPHAGSYHEDLYVSLAYGSRGLCYAPLAAAELLSQIQGSPSPMGAKLRKALNPARFIIRDMIRRKAKH